MKRTLEFLKLGVMCGIIGAMTFSILWCFLG